MADGDIKIHKMLGYVRTTATGGTQISLTPSAPSIVDHKHWLVKAVVWIQKEDILDAGDGPHIRAVQQHMVVEDSGNGGGAAGVTYNAGIVSVLHAASIDPTNDTINMDYVGGLRLWADPTTAAARFWFAEVTIYEAEATVT